MRTFAFVFAKEMDRRIEINFSCVASRGSPMRPNRFWRFSNIARHFPTRFDSSLRRYGEFSGLLSRVLACVMLLERFDRVDLMLSRSLAE